MSRHGYIEDSDFEPLEYGRWRGRLLSSIRGKRGQAFLRELVDALEAMPEKELVAEVLNKEGEVCALGAVALKRGMDVSKLDPEEYEVVAGEFNIAEPLAREIVYENDEGSGDETPAQRWKRMHRWALRMLKKEAAVTSDDSSAGGSDGAV
jgi:hypothetical protein